MAECDHVWRLEWPDTDSRAIRCQSDCRSLVYEPELDFADGLEEALNANMEAALKDPDPFFRGMQSVLD